MFKFLRKYNTWILAVGGTLLMIAFLIPQAIESCSQRMAMGTAVSATVGADNRAVSPVEWRDVQSELDMLQNMARLFGTFNAFLDPAIGEIREPDRWFLLTYEAEQAGLVAPRAPMLSNEDLMNQSQLFAVPPALVSQTLAKITAVNQLVSLYRRAGVTSDNRIRAFAERLMHQAAIQTVVITADPEHSEFEPKEEEILAHFEKYKDHLLGEGDHGFGYKWPHRLKLEWLEIPSARIRTQIENSEAMSGIALRQYWRANENKDGIPPVEGNAPVPQIVRTSMLDELTQQRMDEIARWSFDQLRIRQQVLEQREGYMVLPETWAEQRVAFPQLAEMIRDRFNVPLPAYQAIGDRWLSIEETSDLGPISLGRTDRFGQSLNLRGLINQSKEFGGDGTISVQAGVAGPPLRPLDAPDVFLFRVTDFDPSHVPPSVDEVREQVVKDLRQLNAYQSLLAAAPTVRQLAAGSGMVAVAVDYNTQVHSTARVSLYDRQAYVIQNLLRQQGQGRLERSPSRIPGIGLNEAVLEKIIEYVMEFDRSITDFTTVPEAERVLTVPVEDQLALLVVRILEQTPLSEELFESMASRGDIETLLVAAEFEQGQAIVDAFSLPALIERHNFQRRDSLLEEELNDAATSDLASADGQ